MATTGHVYRDTWYSGQRCHCCNLTDADHAAKQATYADAPAPVCAKCGYPVMKSWGGWGHAPGFTGKRHVVVVAP